MKQSLRSRGEKTVLAMLLTFCFLFATVSAMTLSVAKGFDKVASDSDMSTVEEVGVEGMKPIAAKDVKEGTYDVEMESSSSMFKIDKAVLKVSDGAMYVTLTLSGTAYPYLYAGTAKEAAKLDDASKYIAYETDKEGKYIYTLPVPALDDGFHCAAFSKNRAQWYDRMLLVRADSLPKAAVKVKLPDYAALEKAAQDKRIAEMKKSEDEKIKELAAKTNLRNGSYSVKVDLKGGTGRASITSPTTLTVLDGKAYATVQWDSPNYDYMLIDGVRLTPQNVKDGSNSSFLVPIKTFDKPFTVIADTTAMSTPHEIEYQLTFHRDSVKRYSGRLWLYMAIAILVCLAAGFGVYWFWISDWGKKK